MIVFRCFQFLLIGFGFMATYKTSGKHLSFRMSMDRYEPLIQTFHIICRFPKMGGCPRIIHVHWICHHKPSILGYPPDYGTPCPANAAISTPGCAPESWVLQALRRPDLSNFLTGNLRHLVGTWATVMNNQLPSANCNQQKANIQLFKNSKY